MIIIRLSGGLGNQIFQLGAALLLAYKTDTKKVIIDDSALDDYSVKRTNELINFFDLSRFDFQLEFSKSLFTRTRIPKLLPLNIYKYPFVGDNNFQFILNNPNRKFLLLDGYFQRELTQTNFNIISDILRKIFMHNNNNFFHTDECVVHIRGGDFVKLGWNSITPKEYYVNAMQQMISEYNVKKFKVVTDDQKYAGSILDNLNFEYEFVGSSIKDDFHLIGSCKKRIISSSTFALWASVLGDNDNSIVIAPEYWSPNKKRKIYLPNEKRRANE